LPRPKVLVKDEKNVVETSAQEDIFLLNIYKVKLM
jgi:hypothetical protein